MYICNFSALGELPKKDYKNMLAVLKVLERVGKFSCFEINGALALTMTRIINMEMIECDNSIGYPWTLVKLTDKGNSLINVS